MKRGLWWGLSPLRRVLEGLCLVLLAGGFLWPIALWGRIPDRIPGHFNSAGEIDRWAGKWELFLLPVTGFLVSAIRFAARGKAG